MKTTKRGKLLMLACAALVAVLACLPLLWFRAQDARMFGTVNQSSGLYESREVSGDDFYLLQQVKNRTQMNRDRKSTRLNSSHDRQSRMPSSA